MPNQACEPCAKRKVRCDREEPCTNCKRRKQDHCYYPEYALTDRIKELESQVKILGGDPSGGTAPRSHTTNITPLTPSLGVQSPYATPASAIDDNRSKDPVILGDRGHQYYVESRAWLIDGRRNNEHRPASAKTPLFQRHAPHAFRSIFGIDPSPPLNIPSSLTRDAQTLWAAFRKRVKPLVGVIWDRDLELLEPAALHSTPSMIASDAEEALLSAIYLAGIVSLTDAECRSTLGQPKSVLLPAYQTYCEEALARTYLLHIGNNMILKAVILYIVTGMDRLSMRSLWCLLGLAIHNAEGLGLHRDGTFLGLPPFETEERRRIWWQLQYINLVFGVGLGSTPLILMADWDVRLPLNIEDVDLTPEMRTFPEERQGLTSMSYCLVTFDILDQQRQYNTAPGKGRYEFSWWTNSSVPLHTKHAFINTLEQRFNKSFLQYCDPIKPVDVLVQMLVRSLICTFRQRILLADNVERHSDQTVIDHEQREGLLAVSIQLLEYAVFMHTHPIIKVFEWFTANGFPWYAFMVVLIEASQESNAEKCQSIWSLLSSLYAVDKSLMEFADDRRRLLAAENIVAAWETCRRKGNVDKSSPKLEFVVALEARLAECGTESTQDRSDKGDTRESQTRAERSEIASNPTDMHDSNTLFDVDFRDIDWAFWDSVDSASSIF